MQKFILMRLIQVIPTVLFMSLVVFFLHRFIPGDIPSMMEGELGGDYDRAKVEALLGLDDPAPLAYIK